MIAQQQLCPDCSDLYLKTSTGAKCERASAVGDTTGSGDTDSFTPRVRSDKRSIIILLGKTLDRYLTKYYDGFEFYKWEKHLFSRLNHFCLPPEGQEVVNLVLLVLLVLLVGIISFMFH